MYWVQYTYNNDTGELLYEPHVRSNERMLGLMAQMIFLKQAGENIVLDREHDARYETTAYVAVRKTKSKTLRYRFERINEFED